MRVRSGHRAMGHPPAPSPRSRGCSVELLSQVSGGEIAPPGSLGTGRESLPSSGSYGSASGDQNKPQWANRRGSRWMMALSHAQALTHLSFSRLNLRVAQRGHAKQKRTDLRLVGLGLVVSTDFGVPLVSHAYAGNRPDVTQFADVVSELVSRFGPLAETGGELTLVYDAGQNSADNQELMEDNPLHFVGPFRRRTIPTCWRSYDPATGWWMTDASSGSPPSRLA